jgi:hypothetical protein
MSPTTGYAAAIGTDDLIMSFVPEASWGVIPETPTFLNIRLDSEGFSGSKSRTRPNEIDPTGQAAAAITTKEESTGSLNYSVSCGVTSSLAATVGNANNLLLASAVNGVWTTPVSYAASDVAITAADAAARTATLTATGGAFTTTNTLVKGQFIKLFSAGSAVNCFIARILSVTSATELSLDCVSSPTVAIANAAAMGACTIKGQMLRNGTTVNTFAFQKKLSAALFLRYTGAYPTGGTMDVSVGDYLKATLSFLNSVESSDTTEIAGATYVAAQQGVVVDSVKGIGTVWRGVDTGTTPGVPTALAGVTQKFGIKWSKEGAASQFGIGSNAALGMRAGKLTVSGSLSTYFNGFALYEQYINEQAGPISVHGLDGPASASASKGYMMTVCNGTIMNPKILAGGSGQDVMAEFEIEGNPDVSSTQIFGGKTIQFDYFG